MQKDSIEYKRSLLKDRGYTEKPNKQRQEAEVNRIFHSVKNLVGVTPEKVDKVEKLIANKRIKHKNLIPIIHIGIISHLFSGISLNSTHVRYKRSFLEYAASKLETFEPIINGLESYPIKTNVNGNEIPQEFMNSEIYGNLSFLGQFCDFGRKNVYATLDYNGQKLTFVIYFNRCSTYAITINQETHYHYYLTSAAAWNRFKMQFNCEGAIGDFYQDPIDNSIKAGPAHGIDTKNRRNIQRVECIEVQPEIKTNEHNYASEQGQAGDQTSFDTNTFGYQEQAGDQTSFDTNTFGYQEQAGDQTSFDTNTFGYQEQAGDQTSFDTNTFGYQEQAGDQTSFDTNTFGYREQAGDQTSFYINSSSDQELSFFPSDD